MIVARVLVKIRSLERDCSGNIMIVTALMLPVLMGTVGMGTDVALWFFKRYSLQAAADSSAISAANSLADVSLVARSVASTYGYVDGSDGTKLSVYNPPISGAYSSNAGAVEVQLSQVQQPLFSSLFLSGPVTIVARSVAVKDGGTGCLVALNRLSEGAISFKGKAEVTLSKCSAYANSSHESAMTLVGSSSLTADSVSVVGGIPDTSAISTVNGIKTGAKPIVDPLRMKNFEKFFGCDYSNYSAKSDVTLNPGVYCGGIKINAGAAVRLNPGTYYMDGGCLCVSGGATLQGEGVTIVYTSSTGDDYATATINGGANVNLSAPTEGATSGIVFFGDRRMPTTTTFKLNGGSAQSIRGSIYLPSAAITFTGGSRTGAEGCTQLIADTITFSGNSDFELGCDSYDIQLPSPGSAARLVE